jgi:hypothetical protein
MEAAAVLNDLGTGEWRVQCEGAPFATVATHRDGAGVVVSTQLLGAAAKANGIRPYRFPDLNAADSFVRDLITSFSYLGCQVAQA